MYLDIFQENMYIERDLPAGAQTQEEGGEGEHRAQDILLPQRYSVSTSRTCH